MANSFDIVKNQVKSAARREVGAAEAEVRRQTSLVGQARRLAGAAQSGLRSAARAASAGRSEGVYIVSDDEASAMEIQGGDVFVAADGYIRRTPVQHLRVAPDYRSRIVKRVIGAVVLLGVIAGAVLLLRKAGVLKF